MPYKGLIKPGMRFKFRDGLLVVTYEYTNGHIRSALFNGLNTYFYEETIRNEGELISFSRYNKLCTT